MRAFDPSQLPADSLDTYRPPMDPTAPLGGGLDPTAPMGQSDLDEPGQTAPLAGASAAPGSPGRHGTFGGRYDLRRLVGEGGFGEVWEARQRGLHRRVALKRLRGARHMDPATSRFLLQSFRQEALASASLDHPNIVPIHELIEDTSGDLGLSMKLVEGKPWDKLLATERGSMPREDYLARHLGILLDVAQAVAFAHSRGIIHRDIKPAQVMTGSFGETLLMDWGLALHVAGVDDEEAAARAARELSPEIPTAESGRNPAGTPAYMAPEQTDEDCTRLGPWTDVFLLGGCLYWILEGRSPYASPDAKICFLRAKRADLELPAPGTCPDDLLELLRAAMEPDPRRRMHSADEFRRSLEAHLTGASQRRRAAELLGDVAGRLNGGDLGYEQFATLVGRLDEARALWPGNPAEAPLRRRLLSRYAEYALGHGDLLLARAQAEKVDDEATGPGLRERVRRAVFLRKAVRVSAGALLAVVLVGTAGFSWRLSVEADRAREAQALAERNLAAARAQGEGASRLVDYVLGELKLAMQEEVSPEQGVDEERAREMAFAVAGRVATPVLEYYRDLDVEGWPDDLALATSARMDETAGAFLSMDRFAEAVELTTTSLEIVKARGREDSLAAASLHLRRGTVQRDLGDFAGAAEWYRRAEVIARESDQKPPAVLFSVLVQLGEVARTGRDHAESRRRFGRALALAEEQWGADSEKAGIAHFHLGVLSRQEGRYEEARHHLERGLALRPGVDPSSVEMLTNRRELASALRMIGDGEGALREGLAVLEAQLRTGGENSSGTAAALNGVAIALEDLDRPEEAREYYARALAAYEKALGPEHPFTMTALLNVAGADARLSRVDDARAAYERVLEVESRRHGPDDPEMATLYNNVGAFHLQARDFGKAREYLEKSHAIRLADIGPDHSATAIPRYHYGRTYLLEGRPAEAVEPLREAYETSVRALGEEHRQSGIMREQFLRALVDAGHLDEARALVERAPEGARPTLMAIVEPPPAGD